MTEKIGNALAQILRLYPAQLVALSLTTAFTGITAISSYSHTIPAPEAYIKSEVRAKGERTPTLDPKLEIKYRNNGGSPMIIQSIRIKKNGKVVNSFSDAIGPTKGKKYMLSSESKSFLQKGHVGRNIKSESSFVLCTVRPTDDTFEEEQWELDFRDDILKNKITLETTYSYFHIPLFGPILKGTKSSPLI